MPATGEFNAKSFSEMVREELAIYRHFSAIPMERRVVDNPNGGIRTVLCHLQPGVFRGEVVDEAAIMNSIKKELELG